MGALIGKHTRLVVQGITGRDGSFHTTQMIEYGTNVVGGVTPGKGGGRHLDLGGETAVVESGGLVPPLANVHNPDLDLLAKGPLALAHAGHECAESTDEWTDEGKSCTGALTQRLGEQLSHAGKLHRHCHGDQRDDTYR